MQVVIGEDLVVGAVQQLVAVVIVKAAACEHIGVVDHRLRRIGEGVRDLFAVFIQQHVFQPAAASARGVIPVGIFDAVHQIRGGIVRKQLSPAGGIHRVFLFAVLGIRAVAQQMGKVAQHAALRVHANALAVVRCEHQQVVRGVLGCGVLRAACALHAPAGGKVVNLPFAEIGNAPGLIGIGDHIAGREQHRFVRFFRGPGDPDRGGKPVVQHLHGGVFLRHQPGAAGVHQAVAVQRLRRIRRGGFFFSHSEIPLGGHHFGINGAGIAAAVKGHDAVTPVFGAVINAAVGNTDAGERRGIDPQKDILQAVLRRNHVRDLRGIRIGLLPARAEQPHA